MTQTIEMDKEVEEVRNFLCGYRFCREMLGVRNYERKRGPIFEEQFDDSELLAGNESFWKARMYEISWVIDNMKNDRQKVILYYHYIRGESIENAASFLGVSRRTGYRLHQKGLQSAVYLYRKIESASFRIK